MYVSNQGTVLAFNGFMNRKSVKLWGGPLYLYSDITKAKNKLAPLAKQFAMDLTTEIENMKAAQDMDFQERHKENCTL